MIFRFLLAASVLAASSPAYAACDAMARRLCETARLDCERDCSLLLRCTRGCCEDFHSCLHERECDDRSAACLR